MRNFFITLSIFLIAACTTPADSEQASYPDEPVVKPPVEMCGGIIGAVCSNKEDYCHFTVEARCGAADQTGECRPKPEACTMDFKPVCGCDGETYSNACAANSNGVSVASVGACES